MLKVNNYCLNCTLIFIKKIIEAYNTEIYLSLFSKNHIDSYQFIFDRLIFANVTCEKFHRVRLTL